ncbi:MAG TPA: type II toxin-antitoxin system prevent-host-death family antitoxin, partial [Anaerolineae bacterium]|nr:type II toxin-antitoxin system prevent-host-death family antitoxin [Anaerolineae bacterium]
MIQVTIHEAKTHLSRLIRQALSGEEIIIAKGKKPLIKLVVLPEARQQRRLGGA